MNNNNNNKNMEKSSRPVRNRRHNRRVWPPGDTHRPVKRLFTPEIKRMLKDWLVRRRDNPYPSRDEKKSLAYETGLTYTQICNWFANWRRKLKNSGKEPTKKTWGHLIKNYNVNAKGNVEQFSICSNDSIWGDDDRSSSSIINDDNSRSSIYINQKNDCNYNNCNNNNNNNIQRKIDYNTNFDMINCNENINCDFTKSIQLNDNSKIYKNHILNNNNNNSNNNYYCNNQNESVIDHYYTRKTISNHHHLHHHQPQCFQISSTTMIDDQQNLKLTKTKIMNLNNDDNNNNNNNSSPPPTSIQSQLYKTQNSVPVFTTTNTKYKQQMMEKYLRDYNNSKIISKYSSTSSPSSSSSSSSNSPELSKWLESAANFTPNKSNYYIEWNSSNNNNTTNKNLNKSDKKQLLKSTSITDLPNYVNFYSNSAHQKEELDAAEALANLACNYRQKIITSGNYLSSY